MAASASPLLIAPRHRDLGAFSVNRVLPASSRRTVGPFIFLDHMGPAAFAPGQGLDVRPHPHINLATVTYLFEGSILHRDSLGVEQSIEPGDVNWMTAGRGIVHSERTPLDQRTGGGRLHGIQSWVALPQEWEETEPAFHHHPEGTLPRIEENGVRLRLIAGSAYGACAPVQVFSELFYVHAVLAPGAEVVLPDYPERALYVVNGRVSVDGTTLAAPSMGVLPERAGGLVQADTDAVLMLLGGAPLDEPRHIWWNFVSSRRERIERAKDDWRAGRFPSVPGDEGESIPLPEEPEPTITPCS